MLLHVDVSQRARRCVEESWKETILCTPVGHHPEALVEIQIATRRPESTENEHWISQIKRRSSTLRLSCSMLALAGCKRGHDGRDHGADWNASHS